MQLVVKTLGDRQVTYKGQPFLGANPMARDLLIYYLDRMAPRSLAMRNLQVCPTEDLIVSPDGFQILVNVLVNLNEYFTEETGLKMTLFIYTQVGFMLSQRCEPVVDVHEYEAAYHLAASDEFINDRAKWLEINRLYNGPYMGAPQQNDFPNMGKRRREVYRLQHFVERRLHALPILK